MLDNHLILLYQPDDEAGGALFDAAQAQQSLSAWTVRDLRRRWKPVKAKLQESVNNQPVLTRVHRACSWLEQAELLEHRLAEKAERPPEGNDPDGPDAVLIYQWIAFQSLFGRWNTFTCEPEPERPSWMDYLQRVLRQDESGRLIQMMSENEAMIIDLIGDAYLNKHFWKRPGERHAYEARRLGEHAAQWFIAEQWPKILHESVERVYVLRCQIVMGAATFGSRLNRESLRNSIAYMNVLMRALLLELIDHGYTKDMGALCYPPQGEGI